jgi:CBS-domain-containing membrane protein
MESKSMSTQVGSAQDNPFCSLLQRTPVKKLCDAKRGLTSLSDEASIKDAVITLSRHGILSAPVFGGDDNCVGSFDLLDIVFHIDKIAPSANKPADLDHLHLEKLTVRSVMASSGRNPLTPFFEENPCSMLVEMFAKGIHRVALCSASGEVLRTCSQSDFIAFLSRHCGDDASEKQIKFLATPVKAIIIRSHHAVSMRLC